MNFDLEELQRDNESLQRENGALIRELRELQLKFLTMGNDLVTEIDNSYELKRQLGLCTYGLEFDL
jgi:cell division protein FtsB